MTKSQQQTNATEVPAGSPLSPTDLGYVEEDRSDKRKLKLLKQLLLPIFYYDLTTTQGRRQYCDLITEDPLSSTLMWLPMIILLVLANVHTAAAIWTAAGMNVCSVGFEYFHSTYKPQYPKFYWLSWSLCLTFIGMGIVDVSLKGGIDPNMISAITFTALFVVSVVSTLFQYPFTMQMVQHRVPQSVLESRPFLKLTTILAIVWMLLFGVISIISWAQYLYSTELSHAANIILGTVLPLVLLFGGFVSMQPLGKFLKEKLGVGGAPSTENGEGNKGSSSNNTDTVVEVVDDLA